MGVIAVGLLFGVYSLRILGPSDPPDPAAPQSNELYVKGNMLAAQNRLDDAIEAFEAAQRFSPKNPDIYFALGAMWTRKKDWRQAASAFSGFLKRRPASAEGWLLFGNCLQGLSDISGARVAYSKALTLNPSFLEAQQALQRLPGK